MPVPRNEPTYKQRQLSVQKQQCKRITPKSVFRCNKIKEVSLERKSHGKKKSARELEKPLPRFWADAPEVVDSEWKSSASDQDSASTQAASREARGRNALRALQKQAFGAGVGGIFCSRIPQKYW